MSDKVVVVFEKPWKAYVKDDVAGFTKVIADSLVAGNVAHLHESADTSPKPSAAKAKAGKGDGDGAGEIGK